MIQKRHLSPAGIFLRRVLFLIVLVSLTQCSSTQERWTSYEAAGFNPKSLKGEPCAFGGVVLKEGILLDKLSGVDFTAEELTPMVQADLWTPLFCQTFHRITGSYPKMDWYFFSSHIPLETQEELLAIQATYSLIPPEILEVCQANLPYTKYLILARIDGADLDSRNRWGHGLYYASGRLVSMTLDVYDLDLRRSVFTHSVEYYDNGPSDPSYDEIDQAKRFAVPDSSGGILNVTGQIIKAPPLEPVLEKCMYSLLSKVNPIEVIENKGD